MYCTNISGEQLQPKKEQILILIYRYITLQSTFTAGKGIFSSCYLKLRSVTLFYKTTVDDAKVNNEQTCQNAKYLDQRSSI